MWVLVIMSNRVIQFPSLLTGLLKYYFKLSKNIALELIV